MPPLTNFALEFRHALERTRPLRTGWDLVFIAITLAAVAMAVVAVIRRVTVLSVAVALFAASLLVLTFGDEASYTRLSLPLFSLLLLIGLERRWRPALAVCLAATAMTFALPAAFPRSAVESQFGQLRPPRVRVALVAMIGSGSVQIGSTYRAQSETVRPAQKRRGQDERKRVARPGPDIEATVLDVRRGELVGLTRL
jgi:energy-coupling factor transporter transmembrane protein EcfT